MDDRLIDGDRLTLERKSVLPGEGFFYPDSLQQRQAKQEAVSALEDADIAVVADPDADGLACVALVREARGEAALVPASPHQISDALAWVGEHAAETEVYVCDLCPDSESDLDPLDAATEQAASVTWYDHHQWEPDLAEQVRAAGVDLVVGESDEVCTADVALSELDTAFGEQHTELVAVTRDHDLWLREDERSDDLADYAHWAEPEVYIETVLEHGADLPEDVQEMLAQRRIQKERLIEKAVERARLQEVGPWTVGVTYGRCSQNEVAQHLREQGADASVVVKPSGPASIRGTDAFQRCHEVAAQVNGGGHPKAAGCKPDIYDDMLDYAHHWSTRGAVAKQAILDGFRQLAAEESE
jgi:oligoribonuclease NrnB/cAMP/cGMP phosphodiesterase (DHH superfamily)